MDKCDNKTDKYTSQPEKNQNKVTQPWFFYFLFCFTKKIFS